MGKFKKIEDFADFNPIRKGDTVSFGIDDFENLIAFVESSVIFESNEGKKTMSREVIEKMLKYLEFEATEEDVLAALKEHRIAVVGDPLAGTKHYHIDDKPGSEPVEIENPLKIGIPEKNFSADWKTGRASLYGIDFSVCGPSPFESGFIPLQEIADEIKTDIESVNTLLKRYLILAEDDMIIGNKNPEDFMGPDLDGDVIKDVDPVGFVLVNVVREDDLDNVILHGSREFITKLYEKELSIKSTE